MHIILAEEIIPTDTEPPVTNEVIEPTDPGPVAGTWKNVEEEPWLWLDYDPSDVYLTWVCQSYAAQTTRDYFQSPAVVLDSGASSSVAGLRWARKWFNCQEIPLTPSQKRLKFGPHSAVLSLGWVIIHALIMVTTEGGVKGVRPIQAKMDIAREPIPCLLSRECLPRVGGILHFRAGELLIPALGEAQLRLSEANHFFAPWSHSEKTAEMVKGGKKRIHTKEPQMVATSTAESTHANERTSDRTLPHAEIKKLHVHLAHANKLALARSLRASEIKVELDIIDAVLEACPFEVSRRDRIQPPAVGPHRALWAGHTAMADLWYPVEKDARPYPYMLVIDKFSRFSVTGLLGNISVISVIDFFNSRWVAIFGRPTRLIMDRGTGLVGEQWEAYTSAYGITWISNPTEAPFQGGLFDRCIGVLKYATAAVKRDDPIVHGAKRRMRLASVGIYPQCLNQDIRSLPSF